MTSLAPALVAFLLAGQAGDKQPQSARLLRELEQEFQQSVEAFQKALAAAKTPQERDRVLRDKAPPVEQFAARSLDPARKYARTAAAVDALIWVVRNPSPPPRKGEDPRAAALEILRTRYADSDKLGPLCTQLVFALDPGSEAFLREVLRKAKAEGVKARACASLAQNLKFRARELARLKDDPERLKALEVAVGKAAAAQLRRRDPKQLLAESEKLFGKVEEEHGKVPHPSHGDLANLARSNLRAIRDPVAVGKPAPAISREGVDGRVLT